MRALLLYTFMRFALFAVVLLGAYAAGARGLLLVVIAVVASAALSYLLLRQPRDELARAISARVDGKQHTRFERGVAAGNAEEDAAIDGGRDAR